MEYCRYILSQSNNGMVSGFFDLDEEMSFKDFEERLDDITKLYKSNFRIKDKDFSNDEMLIKTIERFFHSDIIFWKRNEADEVSGQIQELSNVVEKNIINEHLLKFDEYRFFIQSDIGRMKEGNLPIVQSGNVEEHLGKIAAYLKSVIREFENREIDGELGCTIIFNLSIAFAKEINEYSAHYYYETGQMPSSYNDWVAVLESINSPSFKEHLKRYLFFECPKVKMEDKYSTFSTVMFAIETQLGELEFTKKLIPQIEKKEYMNLDRFIDQKIQNGLFYEFGDKVCIPV